MTRCFSSRPPEGAAIDLPHRPARLWIPRTSSEAHAGESDRVTDIGRHKWSDNSRRCAELLSCLSRSPRREVITSYATRGDITA